MPRAGSSKKVVQCDECGRSLTGDLRRHKLTHKPAEIPCFDVDCPQTFRQKGNMMQHYRAIHMGLRDRSCPESWIDSEGVVYKCQHTYKDPSAVIRHRRRSHGWYDGKPECMVDIPTPAPPGRKPWLQVLRGPSPESEGDVAPKAMAPSKRRQTKKEQVAADSGYTRAAHHAPSYLPFPFAAFAPATVHTPAPSSSMPESTASFNMMAYELAAAALPSAACPSSSMTSKHDGYNNMAFAYDDTTITFPNASQDQVAEWVYDPYPSLQPSEVVQGGSSNPSSLAQFASFGSLESIVPGVPNTLSNQAVQQSWTLDGTLSRSDYGDYNATAFPQAFDGTIHPSALALPAPAPTTFKQEQMFGAGLGLGSFPEYFAFAGADASGTLSSSSSSSRESTSSPPALDCDLLEDWLAGGDLYNRHFIS